MKYSKSSFIFPSTIFRNTAGFSLIELIVATSIFAFLVVSAVGVTLLLSKVSAKVTAVQFGLDNIRFGLELMTKELRVGSGYQLSVDCGNPVNTGIKFTTSTGGTRIYYWDSANQRIMRVKTANCADAKAFTSEEIRVERLRFLVRGATSGPNDGQPWITVNMKVNVADPKGGVAFSMETQTSVVQRLRDL